MDEDTPSRLPFLDRLLAPLRASRVWLIFLAGLVGSVAALSIPLSPRPSAVALRVGDVATQDIAAPYGVSFTSEVLTEQARAASAVAVPDVYDPPDGRIARQQLERLRNTLDYIDSVRADSLATPEQQLADLSSTAEVRIDPTLASAILGLPDARWQAVREESVSVLQQVMQREIRDGQLQDARRSLPALVNVAMPQSQADLVVKLVEAFIAPNAPYNDAATRAARDQAQQMVTPVVRSYAAGQKIIGRGELVTPIHIEALRNYGMLQVPDPWREIAIRSLLMTLLGCTLVLYGHRTQPAEILSPRLAVILSASLVLSALAMAAMIPGRTVLPYLFPAAAFPILLAILFSPGMGVAMAVVLGGLAGYLGPRGLELGLYVTLSGALGALVVGDAERLGRFFWAGLASGVAAVSVVVVFRFADPATDMVGRLTLVGASLLSGLLSASLGFGFLLLIGNVFGITTNLQLIELSRPDHPLLQFILRNAPGTYQHSLQVANMAEQAARTIGANALLVRVGALYHDAGKALHPGFFIENQVAGQNIHKQMDPATSAEMILSHVKDGLDLARKYRLPRRIQAFIPEHHGTLEASFQYRAAVEAAGGDADRIDRRDFIYPGPRPRSRETAILMLADGLEAKARAEMPETEEAIERLAAWTIQDRLAKGQLDRTDLTLRDLDTIRRSFVATLKGIYHPRIRYPQPGEDLAASSKPAEFLPEPMVNGSKPDELRPDAAEVGPPRPEEGS
jgi:hypothetical protein